MKLRTEVELVKLAWDSRRFDGCMAFMTYNLLEAQCRHMAGSKRYHERKEADAMQIHRGLRIERNVLSGIHLE